jgi:hypothetical protein
MISLMYTSLGGIRPIDNIAHNHPDNVGIKVCTAAAYIKAYLRFSLSVLSTSPTAKAYYIREK